MSDKISKLRRQAYHLAIGAILEGKQCVMIVFPDLQWSRDVLFMPQIAGVHARFSTRHSGLKSLPVDCLILVDGDSDDFDHQGACLALERTKAQVEVPVHHLKGDSCYVGKW